MSCHYITCHNQAGLSIFSSVIPAERRRNTIPGGETELIYTTHHFPSDLSTDADIQQFSHDRTHGIPDNAFIPPKGTATIIVDFEPNATSAMHRTLTLDVLVVIEGLVELHLDSGEVRTMGVGDSVTQRGTMHAWKNITPSAGRAKMVAFATPIVEPFEVNGKTMRMEFPSQ